MALSESVLSSVQLGQCLVFPCIFEGSSLCELAHRDNLGNQRSRNPTIPVGMARTCVYCYILGVECQGEDFTHSIRIHNHFFLQFERVSKIRHDGLDHLSSGEM